MRRRPKLNETGADDGSFKVTHQNFPCRSSRSQAEPMNCTTLQVEGKQRPPSPVETQGFQSQAAAAQHLFNAPFLLARSLTPQTTVHIYCPTTSRSSPPGQCQAVYGMQERTLQTVQGPSDRTRGRVKYLTPSVHLAQSRGLWEGAIGLH